MSADFWAGYISGAAGIIIGNPLDLIKTRLQAGDSSLHAAPPESLRSTFDRAGTLVRGEHFNFVVHDFLLLCPLRFLLPFYL
jgi:solute carrier family 25 carnitine/acylcarnitine transporter 20/29